MNTTTSTLKHADNFNTGFVQCNICLNIAKEAVESICCHNIFCDSCTDTVKMQKDVCPTCRKTILETAPCHLARRIIGSIPTECPFGCEKVLPRVEMPDHQKKCPKRIYTCSHMGCNFKSTKDEYNEHIFKLHSDSLIEAFDDLNKKKKYNKKGKASGYYKQGGEHPMNGTYKMEDGRLTLSTEDEVGKATWEGTVSMIDGKTSLNKKYAGAHGVKYEGYINEELTEINGKWAIHGSGDDFKLILHNEEEKNEATQQ